MSNRRILAVYGHPDDEGQVTGTLAHFVEAGSPVTLVCATRGEVGEISDPSLGTPETLGYVRELELRAAMAQVGVTDVRFLPFRDSGMAGTPENDDPRCLHQAPAETVVEHLVGIIRDVKPHLVFTWDPTGGYGHPDHVAVHRHALTAFDAAGDPHAFAYVAAPWAPERLYWGAFTMKRFARIWMEMEERGLLPEAIDAERMTRFEAAMKEPDPPVHVIHDVSHHVERKRAAAGMHRSQFGENSMFARLPDDIRQRFYSTEQFFQARPPIAEPSKPARGFD